jgi:hypothetical protein
MATSSPVNRLLALDYLRGFFILVIIIDHLWRWPSVFGIFTGQGQLWISSAEGFVIISGLLVGYIRGYKERSVPFPVVARKLLKRALLLYAWLIGATLVYTAAIWYLPTISPMPWIEIARGDWLDLIAKTLVFTNAYEWVYFLYLYVIFLLLSPLVIWLLRKNQTYTIVIITTALSIMGEILHIEWLEWLPVFFLPTVAGYHLPAIQHWWRSQSPVSRRLQSWLLVGSIACVLITSAVCTFIIPDNKIAEAINDLFTKDEVLYTWRVALALVAFAAFAILFQRILPWLRRWVGWLLLPFGTRSLTAYIIHGTLICLLALLFVNTDNIWQNTAYGIVAVMGTWALLRIPLVQRLVPR